MLRLAIAAKQPLATELLSTARTYATATPLGLDNTAENNLQTETNRLSKTFAKFWDKVTLDRSKNEITVYLDNKPIRTPLGNPLTVSNDRQFLALMLHNEWANLPNLSIKPHSLPLTSVVSRCIDLEMTGKPECDPELVAKVGGDRDKISNDLLRYLDTDTLLCFSPRAEYEGSLRAAQDKLYLPIIESMRALFSQYSSEPVSLQILDADVHGLRGNAQTEQTRAAARRYLDTLSLWDFAVFEKTVLTTKSFICAAMLLHNKCASGASRMELTMEEIAQAATLETIYQVERWGEVEDTHDVDKRDIRRNVTAAAIVAYKE